MDKETGGVNILGSMDKFRKQSKENEEKKVTASRKSITDKMTSLFNKMMDNNGKLLAMDAFEADSTHSVVIRRRGNRPERYVIEIILTAPIGEKDK